MNSETTEEMAPASASWDEAVCTAAQRLIEAQRTGVPIRPVRDLIGDGVGHASAQAAYDVQRTIIRERLAAGDIRRGRKVGLTNPVVQRQLGVATPDFGVLLASMESPSGSNIELASLLQPRIEAEIAFVLRTGLELSVDDITPARVLDAVDYVTSSLEIVDSRIANWDITFADTVADNGSSARFVLGSEQFHVEPSDLVNATMSMRVSNGGESRGTGKDCMGSPLEALTWLARTSAVLGDPLLPGEVVLAGALGPMVGVVGPCDVETIIDFGGGRISKTRVGFVGSGHGTRPKGDQA